MSKYINSLMQMSAASVVLMSAAFADQNSNQCCKPCPPCVPPCVVTDLCYSYPLLQNGYMVHMDVGYILEQFVLTGTDFAYTTDAFAPVLPQSVKVLRPKFNVASGVTAELGFYFEHDHWFVNSRFDWVSRKGKNSWTGTGTEAVVPMGIWTDNILSGTDAGSFTEVAESLKVSYYDLQIDLNRGTLVTHYLAFEPHAGLKAAWIYYKGEQAYTGGDAGVGILNHNQHTSFWGVGPDFGVNSEWRFGEGFGMYWDSTVAILCGAANAKDYANFNDSATYNTYAKQNKIVMSPTARAMFGFQYNSGMFDSSQNIRIRLGADAAYYWNQFQHINVVNQVDAPTFNYEDNGGFGMIGMMIELGWDF